MRVPASPLLVFGFASAATVSWAAPASPAFGGFRPPHTPSSAQNSPAPSHAATFGSPAPDHSATFSPNPAGYDSGSFPDRMEQGEGADMNEKADRFGGVAADVKVSAGPSREPL